MSKRYGQNFLISETAVNKIIHSMGLRKGMKVWEIGPGLGVLTSKLIGNNVDLTCFEIDYGFIKVLKEKAFADEKFNLVAGDFLKTFYDIYEKDGIPDLICGNLPYNVGGSTVAALIQHRCIPDKMVFTLQSEVADRISSSKFDSSYSSFTLLVSLDYESEIIMKIKSDSFWPKPKVESSVIVLNKRKEPLLEDKYVELYFKFLKCLFSQRRKMIKNNLKNLYSEKDQGSILSLLNKCNLTGNERPQDLDLSKVLELVKCYGSK